MSLFIFQKHIVSWSELLDIGRDLPDGKLDDRLRRIAINHCCNVLYSSGTNRPQRGVMLSHDNLTWCSKMVSECFFNLINLENILHIHIPIILDHKPELR